MERPKWLSAIASDVRATLVGATVLSIGGGLWAALKVYGTATALGLAGAITVGVLVCAALAVTWNQLAQIGERARRGKAKALAPDEIKSRIRDWVLKQKLPLQDDPTPGADFRLVTSNENGLKVTIVKATDRPWVAIATRLTFEPEKGASGKQLEDMISGADSTFHADVGIQLALLGGVDYRIDGSKRPIEISIERKVIFDDSMTELSFMREFVLVQGGLNIVTGNLRRGLALLSIKPSLGPGKVP